MPLSNVVERLKSIAGYYRSAFNRVFPTDGTPRAATAKMQQSLTDTVKQVRAASADIFSEVKKIALDSVELNRRTEHQATALDQTRKTMNSLGQTVSKTTENAANAN